MSKRTFWDCDRCKATFEYSVNWGEQPLSFVSQGGPPQHRDLCPSCIAEFERFLTGTPLVNPPSEAIGVVSGTAAVRARITRVVGAHNVHVHVSPSESDIPTETEHQPVENSDEQLLDYDRLAGPH